MVNRLELGFLERAKVFSIPNLLSFSRIVLLVPIVIALLEGYTALAAALVLISFLTDLADGRVARRLNQVSEFGRILDSAADKLTLVVIVTTLAAIGHFPAWAMVLIVGREAAIVGASLYLIVNGIMVVPPAFFSRSTSVVFTVMEIAYIIDLYPVATISLYVALSLMTIAFAHFLQRFSQTFRG